MNTKHHIGSDGHQYLMLDLPEDAWGIELNGNRNRLIYDTIQEYDSIEKRLPTGNWQILGREKELTEEQRLGIVETTGRATDSSLENHYYLDYSMPKMEGTCTLSLNTSEESLSSLTTSLGIDNPLFLKNLDK